MKTQTIKLIRGVMIDGKQASPEDKNNGIYTVTEAEARNLIARKRAIKFDGKIEKTPVNNPNPPAADLEVLKKIADELGIKYNPNIGAPSLEKKIAPELDAKAEEIGLTFAENTPIVEAYEQYKAKKAQDEAESDDDNKVSIEELKEIAKAAEIKVEDDMAEDDLQDFIETELEQYAQELGLEVGDDDNARTLWAKIQEKLKEKN